MLGYIKNYIIGVLPVTVLLFACVAVWRLMRVRALRQKYQITVTREASFLVFMFYMCAVASATFVGYGFVSAMTGSFGFIDNINLIPLKKLREIFVLAKGGGAGGYWIGFFISNVFGNIGLFVPVGFAVPLLWNISVKKALLVCCLISCGIELLQLPLVRVTDIDDVLLNTAGAAVGCLIYAILRKTGGGFCDKFKLREKMADNV